MGRVGRRNLRRKALLLFVFCAAVVLWAAPLQLTGNHVGVQMTPEELGQYWERRIPRLMQALDIPGAAVTVIVDGRPVWAGYFGWADQESKRPMAEDTLFQVGSIAKSVTSWGIADLQDAEKLKLDGALTEYLTSWWPPTDAETVGSLTIRQLLSHTAGTGLGPIDQRYHPDDPDIPELRAALTANFQWTGAAGANFSYSNTGFNVLEVLVEDVSGLEFSVFMDQHVLQPLGMGDASFGLPPDRVERLATGYDARQRPVAAYVYPESASGGLFASLKDIAAFVAAGAVASMGTPANASVQQLYQPQTAIPGVYGQVFSHYGLGHFLEYLGGEQLAVSHGGQGYGWMNHFHLIPETGHGIVILTNSQRSWPFFAQLLTDWSRWLGYDSIGMGVILQAKAAVWALIGLLLYMLLWRMETLIRGSVTGQRRWFWSATDGRWRVWLQLGLAILLLTGLAWAHSQPYLLLTAILPKASSWLGVVLLFVALLLAIESMVPPLHPASMGQQRVSTSSGAELS